MQPELSHLESRAEIESIFREQSDEILNLYREFVPAYLRSLESAILSMDNEKIMHQTHRLNSAMKTIGFAAAAERLQYIEQSKPEHACMTQLVDEVGVFVETTLRVLDDL